MACRIHVWEPHSGMVGHASMFVGSVYISWWPNLDAYGIHGNSRPVPGVANTWDVDVNDEARGEGRPPHYTSPPIDGLDEPKITMWWQTFRTEHSSRWSMDESNCAWVVLTALNVGGASDDWVFNNFFERLMYPPSPVDCQTAAELLVGRSGGAFDVIRRYAVAKVVNPLRNAAAYQDAMRGHVKSK